MATKNFTQFSTTTLTTGDYVVGYKEDGSTEFRSPVQDIINLVGETDSQTLSFNEASKDLSISSGNTVSLSALVDSSIDTGVRALTSNWESTYTTYSSSSGDYISLGEDNTLSARFVPYSGTVQEIDTYVGIEGEVVSDKATIRLMNGLTPGGIKMLTVNDSGGTASDSGVIPLNPANTLYVSSRQASGTIRLYFAFGGGGPYYLACQFWDGTVQVLPTDFVGGSVTNATFTVPTTGAYRGASLKEMIFWPCVDINNTEPITSKYIINLSTHGSGPVDVESVGAYDLNFLDSFGLNSVFNYTGNILDLRRCSLRTVVLNNCPNLYEIFGLQQIKSSLETFQLGVTDILGEGEVPAPKFQANVLQDITSWSSLESLRLNVPNLNTIQGLNLTNLQTVEIVAPLISVNFSGCSNLYYVVLKSNVLTVFDNSFFNADNPLSLGSSMSVYLDCPSLATYIPPIQAGSIAASYLAFLSNCPLLSGSSNVNNLFTSLPTVIAGSELYLPEIAYNQSGIDRTIAENKNWTVVPI